jgi:hypothetical protein
MNYTSAMQMLENLGIPFTVMQCSSSTTIQPETGRKYFFPVGEMIDPKFLQFIKETKYEVWENSSNMELKEVSPKFIRFSPIFAESFKYGYLDFCEVDIVGAYWFTAYDFGLISKTTYLQGLEVPKRIRLMALGAAATTKDIIRFDGKQYHYHGLEFNENGRRAFFNVAKKVDDVINFAFESLPGCVAFYWVDALFVKTEHAKTVEGILSSFGHQTKTTPLFSFTVNATTKTVEAIKIVGEKNGFFCFERKEFFRPKKKTAKKSRKKPLKKLTLLVNN